MKLRSAVISWSDANGLMRSGRPRSGELVEPLGELGLVEGHGSRPVSAKRRAVAS